MTVRIGWDEYEVALLIDACNRIRDNKIDKAECVHKLSNLLRQRAKANGINIDEVFRNENGIALQICGRRRRMVYACLGRQPVIQLNQVKASLK